MIALNARPLTTAASLAAVAVVTLSGCSSSKHDSSPTYGTTATKSSSTATPGQTLTPAASLPAPTGNVLSLFRTVQLGDCRSISGGWEATGTIHNTTGATHTYQILVYFTTDQATVIDWAKTSARVAAGQTAKWSASHKFKTATSMRCVIVTVK